MTEQERINKVRQRLGKVQTTLFKLIAWTDEINMMLYKMESE